MKKTILLWGALVICAFSFAQTEVFINEIHYDNIGADTNEGVEIAGPAGTDLTDWSLIFYNGVGGTVLNTQSLTGIIPNQQSNRGVIWFGNSTDIQNGPDGIALINPLGTVIQFLSYEGSFIATDGLANGITSVDIGVEESEDTTAVGHSLQLKGSGTDYQDFTWATAIIATSGAINNNGTNTQTFLSAPFILASYLVEGLHYGVDLGPSNEGSFVLEGINLTNDILINAPSNFEISETSEGSFSASITLFKGVGTSIAPTTIYIRLKTGLAIGNYTQNGLITSMGALDKSISLNGIVSPNPGSIIITEIMQDPSAVVDADGEYFEVYNTTTSDIDLQGWVISDNGSDSHIISTTVVVLAGGYAVLGRDQDSGANGGFTANYEYSGVDLANGNDEIILTSGATEIDRVEYDGGPNFPFTAGSSMELHLYKYDSFSNNDGSNWGLATTTYGLGDKGTPGANNGFGLSVIKNEIEGFAMYPNPVSNGILYINSNINANKQVEIYTLNGQQVYSKNVLFEKKMNISNLNKGIYFVRIEEQGRTATRKLVVN